jgi:VCBS repeat protein
MRILHTAVAVAAAGASLAWGLAQAAVPAAASGTAPRAWGCFSAPIKTPASGLNGDNAVAGDFDGNHTTDLLVSTGSQPDLWLGDGTGRFVEKGIVTVPGVNPAVGIGRMVTGDFDKDGSLDFAVTAGSSIVVMLNDGHANFQATSYDLGLLQFPNHLATADLNHDGVLDLVASLPDQLVVLLGKPASPGTFGTPQKYSAPGGGAGDVQIGDVDHDSNPDVVWTIPNGLNSKVAISYGDGSGGFASSPQILPASGGVIGLGDFNSHGNGWLDIVTSGSVPATYPYSELINRGSRTFDTRSIPLSSANGIGVADLNADGHLDFVVGRPASSGGATVELGNGDGTFRAIGLGIEGSATVANITGDLQRDRGEDIVVINGTDINVLLNEPCAYHPLPPARILDTRLSPPLGHLGSLGPGESITLQVTGSAQRGGGPSGVPSSGVGAVVMNVTATTTTTGSFLTIWPTGSPKPLASNLNWVAGKTVPNLVEVALGDNGQVSIYNAQGQVDVIADVAGYVASPDQPGAGLFNPVVPFRVLDTRTTNGGHQGAVGPGETMNLQVGGRTGSNVPATGVSAVVLNVTVTGPTATSYLTVFPMGASRPVASNLNFVAGQTVPNRVIVKVGTNAGTGASGWVSIYNPVGSVHVIVDVGGWFTDGSNPAANGSSFSGLTPYRILDTRPDGPPVGNHAYPLGPQSLLKLVVAGKGGVPASGASAVVLNVTVTGPTQGSYLTVYPDDAINRPVVSDLNYVPGQTVPNLVVVKLGADGGINIYNEAGSTDVIADVVGWYG